MSPTVAGGLGCTKAGDGSVEMANECAGGAKGSVTVHDVDDDDGSAGGAKGTEGALGIHNVNDDGESAAEHEASNAGQ
eukprot:10518908-Karenia_brevis.AAC.1